MFYNSIKDEENKIILLFTPRAGCTVSVKMFFVNMGIFNGNETLHDVHGYRIHFGETHNINSYEEIKDYFIFKTIVNPFQRAVSCYHHFCRVKYQEEYSNISLYEYLSLLKNQLIIDPSAIYHCLPQYIYEEDQKVNCYIKLEKGQKEIDEKINIPLKQNYILPSNVYLNENLHHMNRDENVNSIFLGDTKYNEIIKFPKSYRLFYNDEIKKLVEELYKDDIIQYDYKFEDLE